MLEILNKLSQDNGWDNFSDVVYNAENRRTIMQMVEEGAEEISKLQPYLPNIVIKDKLGLISEILSFNHIDNNERIREINKLLN